MKTRKAKTADISAIEGDPKENVSAPDSDREKPNRISFNVTSEGAPDWERMLPKTKDQLSAVLKNPNVQKELGFSPETAKKIEELGFGEDEANALLDMLQGIDSMAASKIYGIPGEITSQAFTFTSDHRKKLVPCYARLMNKWGPAILKQWKDEIGAVVLTFAVLNSQVRLMHILETKRQSGSKISPRVVSNKENVTPISKPEETTVAKETVSAENNSAS